MNDSGEFSSGVDVENPQKKEPSYNLLPDGENKVKLRRPLVRYMGATGVLSVLQGKKNLSTSDGDKETFFFTPADMRPFSLNSLPEASKELYGLGTQEIGAFVVFPQEANKLSPTLETVKNFTQIKEIVIPKEKADGLSYVNYLFLSPEQFSLVADARDIEEAEYILGQHDLTKEGMEEKAKSDLAELLRMRYDLREVLLSHTHEVFNDQSRWEAFYTEFFTKESEVPDIFEAEEIFEDITSGPKDFTDEESKKNFLSKTSLVRLLNQTPTKTKKIVNFFGIQQ